MVCLVTCVDTISTELSIRRFDVTGTVHLISWLQQTNTDDSNAATCDDHMLTRLFSLGHHYQSDNTNCDRRRRCSIQAMTSEKIVVTSYQPLTYVHRTRQLELPDEGSSQIRHAQYTYTLVSAKLSRRQRLQDASIANKR